MPGLAAPVFFWAHTDSEEPFGLSPPGARLDGAWAGTCTYNYRHGHHCAEQQTRKVLGMAWFPKIGFYL